MIVAKRVQKKVRPSKRTIAVVTGTRAEFGLLTSVMRAIDVHRSLQLRTIVAGLHWPMKTWRDVRDAGFSIDAKVRMQTIGSVGREADAQATGKGIAGFSKVFSDMQPDVVLVLGDRIEAFAAASAASISGFRVAHSHGGDRAEGVADEGMRHAISKLSHIHFPATATSRKRLIRMGELSETVFQVGSPSIDLLTSFGLATRAYSEDLITSEGSTDGPAPAFIIAQHPIGESAAKESQWMNQTLNAAWFAMGEMPADAWCLAVAPNRDPGSEGIRQVLKMNSSQGHLPREQFVSYLVNAKAIIGNSSAGLIEAAALRTPCVNIGPRQNGREKPANVIDCGYGEKLVQVAINKALKLKLHRMKHPYGDGDTGKKIADLLAALDLREIPIRKKNAY